MLFWLPYCVAAFLLPASFSAYSVASSTLHRKSAISMYSLPASPPSYTILKGIRRPNWLRRIPTESPWLWIWYPKIWPTPLLPLRTNAFMSITASTSKASSVPALKVSPAGIFRKAPARLPSSFWKITFLPTGQKKPAAWIWIKLSVKSRSSIWHWNWKKLPPRKIFS